MNLIGGYNIRTAHGFAPEEEVGHEKSCRLERAIAGRERWCCSTVGHLLFQRTTDIVRQAHVAVRLPWVRNERLSVRGVRCRNGRLDELGRSVGAHLSERCRQWPAGHEEEV